MTAMSARDVSPFRVLVTGSRTWPWPGAVAHELNGLLAEHGTLTVVHGDARDGADRFAANWAISRRNDGYLVKPEPHPAEFALHGGAAGFRRNAEMVALGASVCLAFVMPCALPYCHRPKPHDTHGTAHCAGLAEAAGIPVQRITP